MCVHEIERFVREKDIRKETGRGNVIERDKESPRGNDRDKGVGGGGGERETCMGEMVWMTER